MKIIFYLGKGFWDLGHKLFRTTPETFPVRFLAGDVFDDAQFSYAAPAPCSPPPPIASVNTLTELRGHVSVILASSLFDVFNEEKQFELGKYLAALLDPRPGSIIFGSQGGMPLKGEHPGISSKMFCHSPESWTQLWEEQIFEKGQVKVNAVLREMNMATERVGGLVSIEEGTKFYALFWSVERLRGRCVSMYECGIVIQEPKICVLSTCNSPSGLFFGSRIVRHLDPLPSHAPDD